MQASLQQVLNPEHSSSPRALPRFRNLPTGVFGTLPENELERDGNELAAGDVNGTNLWRARRTRPPLPALAAARLIPCLVASGKARAASCPGNAPPEGTSPIAAAWASTASLLSQGVISSFTKGTARPHAGQTDEGHRSPKRCLWVRPVPRAGSRAPSAHARPETSPPVP